MTEQQQQPDDDTALAAQLLTKAYEQIRQLETALATSRRIGAAIGVLMVRHGLTYDDAFTRLSETSQRRQAKVRDLAETVLYTGDLPTFSADLATIAEAPAE